jgi:hypothetical protein
MPYLEFSFGQREMDHATALDPISCPNSLQGIGLWIVPQFNLGQTK